MRKANHFEDLEIWRQALCIARETYSLTGHGIFQRDWPFREHFRHCALAIMANIAEGLERDGRAEFRQFLSAARGSCGDLRSHLERARSAEHLGDDEYERLRSQARRLSRRLSSLMDYLREPRGKAQERG